MKLSAADLIQSTASFRVTKRRARKERLVAVLPSRYVHAANLGVSGKPWTTRRLVAEARLLAVDARIGTTQHAFTGESALVALGLEPWWSNPDVCLRRARRSGTGRVLPKVALENTTVQSVRLRQTSTHTETLEQTVLTGSGLPIAPLHVVVLDLARTCHPLQAFHNICILLRHAAKFDRWDLSASRARAEVIRDSMLKDLLSLAGAAKHRAALRRARKSPSHTLSAHGAKGAHGVARALALLQAADPGVESPAESAALWVMHTILGADEDVKTQYEFQVRGRRRFADLALPRAQVLIEVSGYGKFGDSAATAHDVARAAVFRQQDLEDIGWSVVNVSYEQSRSLVAFTRYLIRRLSAHKVRTHPPRGRLWAPPHPLLFARDRRY